MTRLRWLTNAFEQLGLVVDSNQSAPPAEHNGSAVLFVFAAQWQRFWQSRFIVWDAAIQCRASHRWHGWQRGWDQGRFVQRRSDHETRQARPDGSDAVHSARSNRYSCRTSVSQSRGFGRQQGTASCQSANFTSSDSGHLLYSTFSANTASNLVDLIVVLIF